MWGGQTAHRGDCAPCVQLFVVFSSAATLLFPPLILFYFYSSFHSSSFRAAFQIRRHLISSMIYPRAIFVFLAFIYIAWRYHSLLLRLSGRLPNFTHVLRFWLVGIISDGAITTDTDTNVAQLVSAFDVSSEKPDIRSRYFRTGNADVLVRSRETQGSSATVFELTRVQLERAPALCKRIFGHSRLPPSTGAEPLKLQMAESSATLELFLRFVIGDADDSAEAARLCSAYNLASFALLLAVYDCAWEFRCSVLAIQLEEQL